MKSMLISVRVCQYSIQNRCIQSDISPLFCTAGTKPKISFLWETQTGSTVLYLTCSDRYDIHHLSWLFLEMPMWLLYMS